MEAMIGLGECPVGMLKLAPTLTLKDTIESWGLGKFKVRRVTNEGLGS